MATVFTKIINGEIPGRFVWQDDVVVAFMDVSPQTDGHVLVVPRAEIDQWTDLPADVAAHTFHVAYLIGQVLPAEFDAVRACVAIEGFAVPHTHVHVFPANESADFEIVNKHGSTDPADLDDAARRIRQALRAAGHGEWVPDVD